MKSLTVDLSNYMFKYILAKFILFQSILFSYPSLKEAIEQIFYSYAAPLMMQKIFVFCGGFSCPCFRELRQKQIPKYFHVRPYLDRFLELLKCKTKITACRVALSIKLVYTHIINTSYMCIFKKRYHLLYHYFCLYVLHRIKISFFLYISS